MNDYWDRDKLVSLKRYLQRLVNPSQQFEKDKFSIVLVADEFLEEDEGKEDHERVNGPIVNEVFERLDKKTTKIQCTIKGGRVKTTLTDKGRFVFTVEEENEYTELNDVSTTVFFLNRKAKAEFTRIMGVEPKSFGSVFLYKNGFRIHPYGNENNDWLGLDRRKTQGYARFLGNRELIGRIEVYGLQPGFQEVSSRDGGVVESPALRQLAGADGLFITKVLKKLEMYVVEAINWDSETEKLQRSPDEIKRASIDLIERIVGSIKDPEKNVTFNKQLLTIFRERQIEKIPELIRNVEHIARYVKPGPEREYIQKQVTAFRSATLSLEEERKQKERELDIRTKESLFLKKAISSDKDVVFNLNHTIENSTLTIQNIIVDINASIKAGANVSKIIPLIDQISLETQKIRKLASIVGFANFNLKVEEIRADIVLYIREYLERILGNRPGMRYGFRNAEVGFHTTFRPLEVSIILDNFISNSRKAGATAMTFDFEVKEKKLHFLVGDNGRGIPRSDIRFLFTRGFTTTNGSGIGLHHIRDIVESRGGSVRFVANDVDQLGKGACFEVKLG